jgi:hypothetical protein
MMRKSKDITKFDIEWQIKRVSLKSYKTYIEKCDVAADYLMKNKNIADRERVLNYLEGLSMAYKNADRKYILDFKDELAKIEVTAENKCNVNLNEFSHKELTSVGKDLMVRAKGWLKDGYRNEELLNFLTRVLEATNDTKRLNQLNELIEYSKSLQNTHSFFF